MTYLKFKKSKSEGLTFVEVMLSFLILAVIFLPIFMFLTGAVKDTEKFYIETIAISRAKFIMDTLMFQVPWRCIRADNPARIEDPKDVEGMDDFLAKVVPRMFGEGSEKGGNKFVCDGVYTCRKGFIYRSRAKVVDLDYDSYSNPILFKIKTADDDDLYFDINELVPKDADDKYNLIKKIVVQIKWSTLKGKDPKDDKGAKSLFLVGFKSDLDTL
jgi:hypothetical protein